MTEKKRKKPLEGMFKDLRIFDDIHTQLDAKQPEESKMYKKKMKDEHLHRLDGPVAEKRVEMGPKEATKLITEKALELGIDLFGFTKLDPKFILKGRPIAGEWAISMALAMDYDIIQTAPAEPAGIEVTKAYYILGEMVIRLAEHIRSLGYHARAHHPRSFHSKALDVLHKPIAYLAGIGEIGRNCLILTPEFGPRQRLGTVSTDLEFVQAEPMSIGLADFCKICNRCRKHCPTDAIPDEKIEVTLTDHPDDTERVKVWRLDHRKCIPYFVETDGCAVCIKECTFNKPPDEAADFVQKVLKKKIEMRISKVSWV